MSACAETLIRPTPKAVPGVGDVVLVASGKGGVGKSTVAVNLAAALRERGMRVGLLDADIYGPSVSLLMGTDGAPAMAADGRAIPPERHGIPSLSIGNLLPPESALTWKGPLVAQVMQQFFFDVAWPDLDVLVVDLPPGTGDVQLSILENIAVGGAVVVSTPQRVATIDADRAIALFHEYDIPVFGAVETMATYTCPCCGEIQRPFGTGGVAALARRRHVAFLGSVPLDPAAANTGERGVPLVLAAPEGEGAAALRALAEKVAGAIAKEQRARQAASND